MYVSSWSESTVRPCLESREIVVAPSEVEQIVGSIVMDTLFPVDVGLHPVGNVLQTHGIPRLMTMNGSSFQLVALKWKFLVTRTSHFNTHPPNPPTKVKVQLILASTLRGPWKPSPSAQIRPRSAQWQPFQLARRVVQTVHLLRLGSASAAS